MGSGISASTAPARFSASTQSSGAPDHETPRSGGARARLPDRLRPAPAARRRPLEDRPIHGAAPMKLISNWRKVLRHSSAFRLSVLASFLSGAEIVVQVFMDDPP